MKQRIEDRNLAINLRQKGFTYSEIRMKIPRLSKSTLSGWMRGIELSPRSVKRITRRSETAADRGRLKAAISNIERRKERDAKMRSDAWNDFQKFKRDPLFIFGVALYWAEGSKKNRRFQFMNSDPKIVIIMIKWIEKYLGIPKQDVKIRLYIHKTYREEKCENFWGQVLNVPESNFLKTVYKPTLHRIKKNPQYKGCVRLEMGKVVLWVKTMEWQNCFYNDQNVPIA